MASWMGLSEHEAETRLRTLGANTLPTEQRQSFWRLVLNLLREPMIALLLACGGLQVVRVLAVCGGIVLLFGFIHQAWLTGILSGLTLAMALIPEEFPVVLTIFFALGAWRIAQHQVLARRMAAIETLGATTILCTDKTGTLTLNQMTVAQFWTPTHALTLMNDASPFTPDLVAAAEWGVLACPRQPVDPMEQALWRVLDDHPTLRGCQHQDWTLVTEDEP